MLRFFLSPNSPLMDFMTIWQKGKRVGQDPYGNIYFEGKARKGYHHTRRWVKYADKKADASHVPAEFHGWLHHQMETFPDSESLSYRKDWQKPHQKNLTGSNLSYRPPGHVLSGGKRDKASGDYEAWSPDNS